jgi:hypothetical protein
LPTSYPTQAALVAAYEAAYEAEVKAKEQEALNDAYQKFRQADQQSIEDYEGYKGKHILEGYTEQDLIAAHQYQGSTPYCGDFSLAMVINLLTGKGITGDEVRRYMSFHWKQIPDMGIQGGPLSRGAQFCCRAMMWNTRRGELSIS